MERNEFAAIRKAAGLTIEQLRAYLRIGDEKTIRRYENGDRPIPGPIAKHMELLRDGIVAP